MPKSLLYIDITRLYQNQKQAKTVTGVDRVTLAYINRLADVSCAMIRLPKQWLFFSKQESTCLFDKLKNNLPIQLPKKWMRFLYKRPAKQNCFLLHTSHSGLENPDFTRKMQEYHLKGIYFLHDLIPVEFPEYCREGEYEKHQQRLLTMSAGVMVIANSADVANKFKRYCTEQNLSCPKIVYAHLGIESIFGQCSDSRHQDSSLHSLLKNHPFFLMVGTIEARKNHLLILMVWRGLINKLGVNCPKLVIVGKRGWEAEQVFDVLDRSIQLQPYIIELNRSSDADMIWLFNHAQALLFPSHAEGFGLPLVEALKCELPVIASDIQIFHEIGFGVIELVDLNSTELWQEKILQYWSDFDEINKQKMRIKQIRNELPTWDKHFEAIIPSLAEIMK